MDLEKVIYSINIEDVQNVANDILNRSLNQTEVDFIANDIGNHIDWYTAIENSIFNLSYDKS